MSPTTCHVKIRISKLGGSRQQRGIIQKHIKRRYKTMENENNENKLSIFNNGNFGSVRAMLINDEPWFVGKDVVEALGYSRTACERTYAFVRWR